MRNCSKLFLILMPFVSSSVMADYWDCEIGFSSQRWDMVAYGDTVVREVEAERRSSAESKALYTGFWAVKRGFFSSKDIYVCARGNKEENGKACYYAVADASCRRQ
jgi:hypothetical protein